MTGLTPIQKVILKFPSPEAFAEELRIYLARGYVFSTPEIFLMGYADDENETWIVSWGAVADGVESIQLFTFMPYPLKYIYFERRGRPRRYETEKLFRAYKQYGRKPATTTKAGTGKGS